MIEAPHPHCNAEVLHAPGECVYCDNYPDRQAMRVASRTPFSPPEANGWRGNIAWTPQMVADEANFWEGVARDSYGPSGSDELIRQDGRWRYRESQPKLSRRSLLSRILGRFRR